MTRPSILQHSSSSSIMSPSRRDNSNSNNNNSNALISFYQEHCIYLPAMLGWFVFSSLLSSYNKYVFGDGHMAFPCPLLLTSVHFCIQWGVSHLICELFPQPLGTERVTTQMSNREWASVSIPCGMVTALDVGLSNWSLKFITLTFYTMVKSSTPIFVLGWAYWFGIERITWPLVGVICVIAAGEFLTVMGEVNFVMKGFVTCLTASVLSGARWTLVQLKLQTMDPPLKSTLVTMKLLSPSMFWSMLLLSMIIEHPWNQLFGGNGDDEKSNFKDMEKVFVLGAVGGFLAVAMVLCEFYLILHSTAMVLMIGGVIKELTTIMIGVTYFGDKLNLVNVAGICVVFSGVVLYKIVFHLQHKKGEEKEDYVVVGAGGGKLIDSAADDNNHNNNGNRDNDDDDLHDGRSGVAFSPRSVELVDRTNGKHNNGLFSKMTTETISNNSSNGGGGDDDGSGDGGDVDVLSSQTLQLV